MSKAKKGTAKKGTAKKGTAKRGTAKKKGARVAAKASSPAKKTTARKRAATPTGARRRDPETLRLRSVSPGLTVADIHKSIGWYRDVLGFIVEEEWNRDGRLVGAGMLAGTVRFFLGQDDWAKGRDRPKGIGFRLHLTTAQDVDRIAARIKANGGRLESEPADMPWGSRAFTLVDPDGFALTIST
jgi:lactoylglutathione lyase